MKDISASIKARLLVIAQKSNKKFELILLRYCVERLLFRLGESPYKNMMYLKGGSLIYAWEKEDTRPTRDIDMLAKSIQNDLETIKHVFQEIASIQCEEDGVSFDVNNIYTEIIQKEGGYSGVRTNVTAFVGAKTHSKIQIDMGFGDIVIAPTEMNYPTFLEMKAPVLQVYSRESVIAEKFEAMIDLAEQNSRMKDFYDVFCLLEKGKYNKNILKEAIRSTFAQRKTPYIENAIIFSNEFISLKKIQWEAFLRKNNLVSLNFETVLAKIKMELQPIYENINT